MSHDTPEAIAITDKAAQDLMLSELLQVCTQGDWTVTDTGIRDVGGYIAFTPKAFHYPNQDERYEKEILEREANAKLIALAPTIAAELIKERALNAMLLEALKAAKNWHSGDKWRDDCTVEQRAAWEAHRDLLDAAINKAEGVQQ